MKKPILITGEFGKTQLTFIMESLNIYLPKYNFDKDSFKPKKIKGSISNPSIIKYNVNYSFDEIIKVEQSLISIYNLRELETIQRIYLVSRDLEIPKEVTFHLVNIFKVEDYFLWIPIENYKSVFERQNANI
ncbi:hypothetical protein NZD85_04945 [Empedobacter stercoris]|uniref:hypothetical protein n=1 Tax=Empedobacter stercoris TaxID=1628248 RepID=UPI0021AFC331|nr:hypothetical protein [Empedobacter stercoris]UWX67954.1 hypothetical protein NZD85_04945 [Empedobacter stercoris]